MRPRRRSWRRFQFDTFDLLIGPELEGRFNSEAEWGRCVDAMGAWYRVNGDEFEREHADAGSRTWAWWTFVAREDMPAPWDEFARLQEMGVMTPEEEAEAVTRIASRATP